MKKNFNQNLLDIVNQYKQIMEEKENWVNTRIYDK